MGEPCSEEDVAALTAYMENITQTSTFEGIVAAWEVFCQDVLAKAELPPWDKYVRIYENGAGQMTSPRIGSTARMKFSGREKGLAAQRTWRNSAWY